jgi:hypothetical protein
MEDACDGVRWGCSHGGKDDEGTWCYILTLSPSGHSVTSFPNRVLYSHTGLVGTAEDLLSQTTKSKYHVIGQVI